MKPPQISVPIPVPLLEELDAVVSARVATGEYPRPTRASVVREMVEAATAKHRKASKTEAA